jgi:hypothetical protein
MTEGSVWFQLKGEIGGVTHIDGEEENSTRALRDLGALILVV